jgi:hypothetical protein
MLTSKLSFSKWLALSVPLCWATYVRAQSAPSQNPAHDNYSARDRHYFGQGHQLIQVPIPLFQTEFDIIGRP